MSCSSCEVLVINGLTCHETGCPESHVGTVRECRWCGSEFEPESRGQHFCSDECAADYTS